jgi:arabinogalactan oligomer/maltooligosaccharide transport system substrate-binding protein
MNTRNKKWMSMVIMLVLALVLAACGGGNNNAGNTGSNAGGETSSNGQNSGNAGGNAGDAGAEEPQIEEGAQLLVWDNSDAEFEWAQYVAEEFTKQYGIPVTVENVNHTDAPGKLQTDGPAGLGADVFLAPHDHTGNMASAGLILENFYSDEIMNEHIDAAITGGSFDGKLYGYPIAVETYGLFYNKDLAEKAPETWEELFEMAKAFNDSANQKYGFMYEVGNFYYDFSFIGGYGGYVFGSDNTDPNDLGLNSEAAVKAAQFVKRIHDEILPIKKEDITYDIKDSLFKEGKLLFNVNGPWAAAGYRDAGVNFGVAPLPKLDNGEHPTSFSGIKSYYVNAYTKYPEAASLYAKFAASKEMQLKRFEITGQVPTRKSLSDDPTIKSDPVVSGILEQAQYSIPMPNIPEMQTVWGPMASAFSLIWNENIDPQQALDDAKKQIEDAIKLMQ